MQCSKGGTDEPVATPTPKTQNCASGQTPQADGTCKAPDGTIICPIGQSQNASGKCVAITCPSGQTLNASNGQCETQCVGYDGPTVMLYKYLNKTNPNPPTGEVFDRNNSSIAFMMAKGCRETNVNWLSSQANFNTLSYMEFKDGITGITVKSLNFVSNTWDQTIVKDFALNLADLKLYPKKLDGSRVGTVGSITATNGTYFLKQNCASANCFIRLDNSFLRLPETNALGYRNLPGTSIATNGNGTGVDDFSAITSTDLGDPTKFNPLIKTNINKMYEEYAASPGVTWSANVNWRTVLIP